MTTTGRFVLWCMRDFSETAAQTVESVVRGLPEGCRIEYAEEGLFRFVPESDSVHHEKLAMISAGARRMKDIWAFLGLPGEITVRQGAALHWLSCLLATKPGIQIYPEADNIGNCYGNIISKYVAPDSFASKLEKGATTLRFPCNPVDATVMVTGAVMIQSECVFGPESSKTTTWLGHPMDLGFSPEEIVRGVHEFSKRGKYEASVTDGQLELSKKQSWIRTLLGI